MTYVRACFFLLLCLVPGPTWAWNGKGHMVIGRLAWKQLSADERAALVAILTKHPHYEGYLKADRPENIPEEEWVFLRAGTWPDWVRSGKQRSYHRSEWHYINQPIVPAGDRTRPPALPKETIVTRIAASKVLIRNGNQEDRAIHLCWLIHLVGDIHQPLHCVALYSKDFPEGDRGGNLSLLKVEGRVIQLHSFWDGLLGNSATQATLTKSEQEIGELLQDPPVAMKEQLAKNLTPASWAKEGLEIAREQIYRNGEIRPAKAEPKPPYDDVPDAPERYAQEAGATARWCVAKAGYRLSKVLKEVVARPYGLCRLADAAGVLLDGARHQGGRQQRSGRYRPEAGSANACSLRAEATGLVAQHERRQDGNSPSSSHKQFAGEVQIGTR